MGKMLSVYLMGCFLGATVAAAAGPGSAASQGTRDWPQWRGPHRDAVSAETGILKEWPAAGPPVLWRIPVGEGFSSISVADGRLFTLWDEGSAQYLVSLDAENGKELWRYEVGKSFRNNYGNGPRSTPAVDGGVVYAVSTGARLFAVDAREGRKLWSHDLPAEYGARPPAYGYSSSPIVEGGNLVVEVGGGPGHAFMAFDKSNGDLVWASQDDAAAYSSPFAATIGGVRQVVFFSASGLFALAADDGRLLWTYDWSSSCPQTGIPTNVAQPIFIAPDKIFLSGGYGTKTGSAVLRVRRFGEELRAETLWQSEQMRNQVNSSVYFDGHVYGFDVAIMKAIDASTGEEKWKARGFERGSLLEADGHLIVLGENGRLALVEATAEGYREKASFQALHGKSWTMPTLAGGRLYLRNQTEMVSLDLSAAGSG